MRSTRSAFRCVALAGLLLAAGAASAGAGTFCVQVASCPAGGTAEPTIQTAINAAAVAAGPDRILLGPVTFAEVNLNAAAGNQVDLVGAGTGQTVLAPPAANSVTTLTLADPGSTVSDLTARLADGTTNVGLSLSGTARRVTVTAADGTTGSGVFLAGGGGSFLDGTVSLPLTGSITGVNANGAGTVANSSITARNGILGAATVQRVRVDASSLGILASPSTATPVTTTVDDALVRIVGNAAGTALGASGGGLAPPAATLIARHVTAIGNGVAGSTGILSIRTSATPGPRRPAWPPPKSSCRASGSTSRAPRSASARAPTRSPS